jgi:hypothetical protein
VGRLPVAASPAAVAVEPELEGVELEHAVSARVEIATTIAAIFPIRLFANGCISSLISW